MVAQAQPSGEPVARLERIETNSVAMLAYAQIRAMILEQEMAPGTRLSQLELADQLGTSRTPVREALRRLAGEGLVDALPQRGFRVADLGLEAVMRRLEVRVLLEPGVARLAAARRQAADLVALREAIELETAAHDSHAIHDASRLFHMNLARATHNAAIVATLDSLWIGEVGRRLLARRAGAADWRHTDIREHEAILAAVQRGDGEEAERLVREHIDSALRHWNPLAVKETAAGDPEVTGAAA
jgi:DNA-binding GntR family transcriptional regulator